MPTVYAACVHAKGVYLLELGVSKITPHTITIASRRVSRVLGEMNADPWELWVGRHKLVGRPDGQLAVRGFALCETPHQALQALYETSLHRANDFYKRACDLSAIAIDLKNKLPNYEES